MIHTLLPYDDLKISAVALTTPLLEKQITDCIAILNELHDPETTGRYKDKTVAAWSGSELQLCAFGLDCVEVWRKRSDPTILEVGWIEDREQELERHLDLAESGEMSLPPWVGRDWVHLEYKGLLIWMEPDHYGPIWPSVAPCTPALFRHPS